MKDKKKILIITILMITLSLVGATFAYWSWITDSNQHTNIVFTVAKYFSCAADGGGDITSDDVELAPTVCTDSDRAIQREIVVTPTLEKDDLTIHMNLWLNVNSISQGLSESLNFKYALTTSSTSCTEGVIYTGNFNGLTTGDQVKILGQSYNSSEPQTYYLYIWLDKVETSSNSQKQTFDLSLSGNCNDATSADLSYNVTSVDNVSTFGVGSGFYTLSSHSCENGTTLSYDTNSKVITSNGIDKCELQFASVEKKLYDVVEIGDYIEYFGDNGCEGVHCNGWNAYQTATNLYENYGYSGTSDYKFTVYGWRVLYKNDNSVYIVSAGAPEASTADTADSTLAINNFNEATLKYCNTSYLSNGICNYETAHAFNGDDFYKFTSQYYGEENGRYLYNYDDGGTFGEPYCHSTRTTYCGYNNDLIDNKGYYCFASVFDATHILCWYPIAYNVAYNGVTKETGFRPVLKLDSSILATGGNGTQENPYTISERYGA